MLKYLFEFCLGLLMIWILVGQIIQHQLPDQDELHWVHGKVLSADWVKPKRGDEYLSIQLIENPYRLSSVTTRVADNPNDFVKDELISVAIYNNEAWQIQVGEQMVQSFDETMQARKQAYRRQQYLTSLMVALLLLFMANRAKNWYQDSRWRVI
ncbi:hypothetical protein NT239_09465 [Chitinibacter sp. SCUT-21]|uniref:hypothetical protein n=1 Tax=Chitinibacter sp. SCUT-21 TaxID=2970891 RepID=UPI0035A6A767